MRSSLAPFAHPGITYGAIPVLSGAINEQSAAFEPNDGVQQRLAQDGIFTA